MNEARRGQAALTSRSRTYDVRFGASTLATQLKLKLPEADQNATRMALRESANGYF